MKEKMTEEERDGLLSRIGSGIGSLGATLMLVLLAIGIGAGLTLHYIWEGQENLDRQISFEGYHGRILIAQALTSKPGGIRMEEVQSYSSLPPRSSTVVALGSDLSMTYEKYQQEHCHFEAHIPTVGYISLVCDDKYPKASRKEPEGTLSGITPREVK